MPCLTWNMLFKLYASLLLWCFLVIFKAYQGLSLLSFNARKRTVWIFCKWSAFVVYLKQIITELSFFCGTIPLNPPRWICLNIVTCNCKIQILIQTRTGKATVTHTLSLSLSLSHSHTHTHTHTHTRAHTHAPPQLSPQKTLSVWFISILNYGDTENVLINHLLLVIPMSYPCHYTNLCPHKPHKHTHTHTHSLSLSLTSSLSLSLSPHLSLHLSLHLEKPL